MVQEPVKIPANLDEALEDLVENMPPGRTAEWAAYPRRKATALAHMGIGTWMRNNWGLWHGSELQSFLRKEYLLLHADDMSGLILDTLWSDLNFKPRLRLKWAEASATELKKQFPEAGNMLP